jgi:hypothetical protein
MCESEVPGMDSGLWHVLLEQLYLCHFNGLVKPQTMAFLTTFTNFETDKNLLDLEKPQ